MPSWAAMPSRPGLPPSMKAPSATPATSTCSSAARTCPRSPPHWSRRDSFAAKSFGVTMFLDGPDAKPSESIHLLFAGEKVRAEHPFPVPDLVTIDDPAGFRVITLESLVRMKLLSNRDKDRPIIRDLIGVGLIDSSWLAKLPPVLAERCKPSSTRRTGSRRLRNMPLTPGGRC